MNSFVIFGKKNLVSLVLRLWKNCSVLRKRLVDCFFLMKFDTICMLCVCMIANRSLGKGNSLLIHLNTLLGVKIALYIIFLREKF